jgi:hypothetical protein
MQRQRHKSPHRPGHELAWPLILSPPFGNFLKRGTGILKRFLIRNFR